VSVKEF